MADTKQPASKSKEELESILQEIQDLQKSLGGKPAPKAKAAAPSLALPPEVISSMADSIPEVEPEGGGAADDTLGGLRQGGAEASMEDTLAAFKPDESAGGAFAMQETEGATAVPESEFEIEASEDDDEEEFEDAGTPVQAASEEESDADSDEIPEEISEAPEEEAVAEAPATPSVRPPLRAVPATSAGGRGGASVTPSSPSGGAGGTLSMTLSGSMTLRLRYQMGGQDVDVSFQEETLRVTLADGTEFKIPVARTGGSRAKVAA